MGCVESPEGRERLTSRERLILEALLRAGGRPVGFHKLARVSGTVGGRSALSNAVSRLRAKVEEDPSVPVFLFAVRGEGYRLEVSGPKPRALAQDEHTAALRSLAKHVGRVLGVSDCVVYRREGDVFAQVAAFGPKCGEAGAVIEPLRQRLEEGLVGHAAAEGRPVCVADVRDDERYLRDLGPAVSELAVPIVAGGRVVGVLDSESNEPSYYGAHLVDAFLMLAAIAAPAFRNVVE